jgi:hypothetical protein
LLLENDGKPARERLTLIRVFEELRSLGYEGGYDAVHPRVLETIARGSPTPGVKPCDTTRFDLDVPATGMRKTLL